MPGRQQFQEELQQLEAAGARGDRSRRHDARPHARGARASGHRARVDRHPRRRPHRRALPRGPAGDPVAAGAAGAGRVRPAAGRRAAARDQARGADGRPVREHRQDAAGGGLRPAQGRGRCSSSSSRWAGSRAREVEQCKQAFLLRDVAVAEDLVRQDLEINRLEPLRVRARGRDRHRRRPARVGDVDDARRARAGADRRQRRGHRRAGRVRRHGAVPGVLGRLARDLDSRVCAAFTRGSGFRVVNRSLPVGFGARRQTFGADSLRSEMTGTGQAQVGDERRTGAAGQATVRLAIIDSDTGFLQVLGKRLEGMGWQYRVLASPVPLDAMVALRLNAVVVDLAVLGPQGWTYLDKLCARLPGPGRDRLHRPVLGGPAGARAAARRRRLGHQALPPRRADRPHRGRRAAPQARRRARREGPGRRSARSRSAPTSSRPSSAASSVELTRREFELIQLLAEAEGQVLQREEIYQRVWGYAMVHGDRSVDVFVRKLRSKLEKASPSWRYIHTHFGIGYRFSAEPVDVEPVGAVAARAGRRRARAVPAAVPECRSSRSTSPRTRVGGPRWTATRTSATSRSSSRSPSPSGSSQAAAPPPQTISNIFSVLFLGGLFFFGYRIYMEHRETIFSARGAPARAALRRPRADRLRVRRHLAACGRPRRARRHALARHARRRRLGDLQRLAAYRTY